MPPVTVVVPSAAAQLVATAPAVAFSGSRQPAPVSLSALHAVAALVPASAGVLVGCARGIDAAAREAFAGSERLHVFRASTFGRGAWAFAARSAACVRATSAGGGVWCTFPSGPCPAGLAPSRSASACFSGFGSGTWASLALAPGLGLPAVVFLAARVPPPSGWGLQALDGSTPGSWFLVPGATQLTLL